MKMTRKWYALIMWTVVALGQFDHIAWVRGLGVCLLIYGLAWDADLWIARRKARREAHTDTR